MKKRVSFFINNPLSPAKSTYKKVFSEQNKGCILTNKLFKQWNFVVI